jgi:hypothetical protein
MALATQTPSSPPPPCAATDAVDMVVQATMTAVVPAPPATMATVETIEEGQHRSGSGQTGHRPDDEQGRRACREHRPEKSAWIHGSVPP